MAERNTILSEYRMPAKRPTVAQTSYNNEERISSKNVNKSGLEIRCHLKFLAFTLCVAGASAIGVYLYNGGWARVVTALGSRTIDLELAAPSKNNSPVTAGRAEKTITYAVTPSIVADDIVAASRFLHSQTIPKEAVSMAVSGAGPQTSAWRLNGRVYLKTQMALIFPKPIAEVGQDGTRVYMIDPVNLAVLYFDNQRVKAVINSVNRAPSNAAADAEPQEKKHLNRAQSSTK